MPATILENILDQIVVKRKLNVTRKFFNKFLMNKEKITSPAVVNVSLFIKNLKFTQSASLMVYPLTAPSQVVS